MTKAIGIIGLGSISKRHINNIKNLYPDYKIALLSSRNFSKDNYDNISSLDILDIFLSIWLNFVNIYKIYLPGIEFCPIRAT